MDFANLYAQVSADPRVVESEAAVVEAQRLRDAWLERVQSVPGRDETVHYANALAVLAHAQRRHSHTVDTVTRELLLAADTEEV